MFINGNLFYSFGGIVLVLGKNETNEEILRSDKLDPETCSALKGVMDEDGKCIIRAKSNPKDPDTLVLQAINYHHRGRSPSRDNHPRRE
jgi:hypothetical protein